MVQILSKLLLKIIKKHHHHQVIQKRPPLPSTGETKLIIGGLGVILIVLALYGTYRSKKK